MLPMPFNFSVKKKKLINDSVENKISDSLNVNIEYSRIKDALISGGVIDLQADVKRKIEISNNFMTSIKIPQQKFTNFIDKNKVSESVKQTFNSIIKDVEFICENNEIVDFSRQGSELKVLRTVLKEYNFDGVLSEENESIFKIDGISVWENGKKENPFRIYLQITRSKDLKESNYKLLFCDIYHLCLLSWHNGKNPEQMRNETFSKHYYTCKDHLRVLLDEPL